MPGVDFDTGDVVMLRSGGPGMTIDNVREDERGFVFDCVWFDDDKQLHRDAFSGSQLVSWPA